jgi:hypothetical protein
MSDIALATQRLGQSRMRLQQTLREQTRLAAAEDLQFTSAASLAWVAGLHKMPGLDAVLRALQSWWAQHPLHATSSAAWDRANTALRPLLRRHPTALLAGAVAIGGLVALSRPWRWAFKPALLTTLLPHLVSSILAAHPPPAPET